MKNNNIKFHLAEGRRPIPKNNKSKRKYIVEKEEDFDDDGFDEEEDEEFGDEGGEAPADLEDEITDESQLTQTQSAQVEDWVDDILNNSLEFSDDNGDPLDIDADGEAALNGVPKLKADVPIEGDVFEDIIEQPDSLNKLQSELENAALSLDDELGDDDGFDEEGFDEEPLEESFGFDSFDDFGVIDTDDDYDFDDFGLELSDALKSDKKSARAQKDFNKELDKETAERIHDDGVDFFAEELESLEGDFLGEAIEELEGAALDEAIEGLEDVMLDEAIQLLQQVNTKVPNVGKKTAKSAIEKEYQKVDKVAATKVTTPEKRNWQVLRDTKQKFQDINKKNLDKAKTRNASPSNVKFESARNERNRPATKRRVNENVNSNLEKIKLENYALQKANSILALAGNMLTEDAKISLTEGFMKCKNKKQINEAFQKFTQRIKSMGQENAKKKSLNESVTKIDRVDTRNIDYDLERKKHLMGLKTTVDVYNK